MQINKLMTKNFKINIKKTLEGNLNLTSLLKLSTINLL